MSNILRLSLVYLLIACSASVFAVVEDPLEGLNRKTFALNEQLDTYLARPAAKAYLKVTPAVARQGVKNFFGNLGELNILLNDLLQGKFKSAANDAGRFLVNTTLGLGGLFDPASRAGLVRNNEDWGQTLAVWHVGDMAYLTLPFLGPSTVKDGVGLALDSLLNPLTLIDHVRVRNSLYLLDKVDARSGFMNLESLIIGEKYTFLRDAYLQNREYLSKDGEVEDLFDDEF